MGHVRFDRWLSRGRDTLVRHLETVFEVLEGAKA